MQVGTLKFSSGGRPVAECPKCNRLHTILRRGDYLLKPVIRFVCKNPDCKTSWYATDEERQKIAEYYENHQNRKRGRPSTKTAEKKPETNREPARAAAASASQAGKKSVWSKFLDID